MCYSEEYLYLRLKVLLYKYLLGDMPILDAENHPTTHMRRLQAKTLKTSHGTHHTCCTLAFLCQ